jgi:hypothetical protein
MSLPSEKKIIVSDAPISGPARESSYQAGRDAGEEDRQAGVVAAGDEVPVEKVRRITERYRTDLDLIGGLALRDKAGPMAEAHAAHEAAGHRLAQANALAEETGVTVLASTQERGATADQITGLVNPELVRPRPPAASEAGAAGPAPTPAAADAAKAPRAFRHILDRKMPKSWAYGVLVALAAAEGFLNVQAFAATGESSNGSFILAVLVGIGVIGLAHRIGDCAADLLENRTGARGRSPARIAEVALGVPSLIIGIIGTAAIRARYYAAQNQAHPGDHIEIPTLGLVALAFMLAAAAIAVSMAMRNPFADDLARQDLAIADNRHHHQEARDELLDAQGEVSATAAALRRLCEELVNEYRIQRDHVGQCAEAYLDGYCTGAGVHVTDRLPSLDPPQLVADARTWLDAHPFGTLAPPTLPFSAARWAGPDGKPTSSQETGQDRRATKTRFAEMASAGMGEDAPAYGSNGSARQES